jgi:hypothetical protein
MPADLSAEPRRPTALRTSTDSSPATSLGYRDRRLCRPPDCADLDTACLAHQEIPTRDIGTFLFGCLAALLRLGAIAGAGLAYCYPILSAGIGVKRWHGRGSPSGLPCVFFPPQLANPHFAPYGRGCVLSACAALAGLQPCSAGGRPRMTSAQAQGRHNAKQRRRVRRSRRARTRSFGVLI